MALIVQGSVSSRDPSSPQPMPGPDYEAEADRGRLKLLGDRQLRRRSQLAPPENFSEGRAQRIFRLMGRDNI
jgi:hypothetical protein